MRFLIYALIALAIALSSLAAIAGDPAPVPTLRPALPNELSSQESAAKAAFMRQKFPGATRIAPECNWTRVDPTPPPSKYKYRLTCSPMEIAQ